MSSLNTARDRVSATKSSFPFMYLTVDWYFCNLSLILCNLRGALLKDFLKIVSGFIDLSGLLHSDAIYPCETLDVISLWAAEGI